MSTTTANKNVRTLIAAGTSVAAGGVQRGAQDMRTALGGLVTLKITNGATGPTTQCEGRVLISHNSGTTPATGAAGSDWKTIWKFGGGTTANSVTERSFQVPKDVMHLEVEFTGNTGQTVTAEAIMSETTSMSTAA